MKRGILLLSGILSLFTLASCNEETKIEYRDRIVEVEKPVEVIKEVEVVKEVESCHSKGGQPYYQCIVYYDYALSV